MKKMILFLIFLLVPTISLSQTCEQAQAIAEKSPAAQTCGYLVLCTKLGVVVMRSLDTNTKFSINKQNQTLKVYCKMDNIKETCAKPQSIACSKVCSKLANKDGQLTGCD